jgi:hypothetical protein
MQISPSNKNKAVYQLVKMMHNKHKPILFTGDAIQRKAAFIKELRTHYPTRVTLNATTIPAALSETVKIIIVENVSDTETLQKWHKFHSTGIISEMNPNKMIYPDVVIVSTIDQNEFISLCPKLLSCFQIVELN